MEMLNALINWAWPSKKKAKNSKEVIIPFTLRAEEEEKKNSSTQKIPESTAAGNTRQYITYEEALKNLEESSECHLNNGYFMDRSDPEAKRFTHLVQKEISRYVVDGSIKDLNLRGRKSKGFTAWVLLQDDAKFQVDESFLDGGSYGKPGVTAVTLLIPEGEKRGLRISIDEDNTRLYEIVNGSYNIIFNWDVDDKICSVTVNINSINGMVNCVKVNEGLTLGDLDENKDAKIRIGTTKNRKMTLRELISLCKQHHDGSEITKFVAGNSEERSALEAFLSQLQQESSY